MVETFGDAGQRLFEQLGDDDDPLARFLVIEACRTVDRLSQLNAMLTASDKVWARITEGRDGTLELRIDGVLQMAQQQANTFRQLVAEIRRQRGPLAGGGSDDADGLAGL